MTGPEITAIPTLYEGVQYRSRLEADTAWLLDRLSIPHAYEPQSYLLRDGGHYRPDFALWGGQQILEVRGYHNAKGDRQIVGMCQEVFEGRHGNISYYVLMDDGSAMLPAAAAHWKHEFMPYRHSCTSAGWRFVGCGECRRWNPATDVRTPCGAPGCGFMLQPWPNEHLTVFVISGVLSILTDDDLPKVVRAIDVNPLDHVIRVEGA